MRILLYGLCVVFLLREATAGVVRKRPAYSTPVYSDSYLPAAMQVIFHSVEQLKALEEEELSQNSPSLASSTSPPSMQRPHRPTTVVDHTSVTNSKPTSASPQEIMTGAESSHLTEQSITTGPSVQSSSESHVESHEETPEVNEETPETNYATPEANYETPEAVHGSQEINEEVAEVNEEHSVSADDVQIILETSSVATSTAVSNEPDRSNKPCGKPSLSPNRKDSPPDGKPILTDDQKKKPTIDSIVEEIYEIVKPTASEVLEEPEVEAEGKNASGVSQEKIDSVEDEEDETRFTLLGEKVAQVPRPSLSSYLKRAKVPPSASLQQLGALYDALSKDARKQGFGKYAGYSDEVLRTLERSAEDGVGAQLKILLEKIVQRSELTRDDAKSKTTTVIGALNEPASVLNKDLRRLLPLRYSP